MPFKLKLKKSRHYSVVSKSLFVISVEILDGTNVECTLSSESTGQDCLEVVCQKLGLNQPMFFGLQYVSQHSDNDLCWVELDRPIKRQLDKHARGLNVHLRVMYYVISGVRLINDEVTRYHYFLQLKMDVIDGRISCNPQQAVELASYSMQAEFGNFDAERHTANYLKDFQLFPKAFTDPTLLESLTEAASRQHAALHDLPQGTAEEYYICACQRLDGYGQELYAVRDSHHNDVFIGVSLTGVHVTYSVAGKASKHYAWSDISNIINNKRGFTIEPVGGSGEKVDFQFGDVESAKNAWKYCVLQHMFYRQYEMNNEEQQVGEKSSNQPPLFQQAHIEERMRQMESYEDITSMSNAHWERPLSSTQSLNQRAQSTSCLDLNKPTDIDQLRSLLPSYRPAPDYETAVQQKYRNSSSNLPPPPPQQRDALSHGLLYSSQPEIHQTDAYLRYPDVTHNNIEKNVLAPVYNGPQGGLANRPVGMVFYKTPPPYPSNRISSNSTPDLAGISQNCKPHQHFLNIVSGSSPDLVSGGNFYVKQPLYGQMYPPQAIHRSHSYLPPQHGTYENLASIFGRQPQQQQQALLVENPNITKHIKKVVDGQGNIIYCMPANMKQILHENQILNQLMVPRNANGEVCTLPHLLRDNTEPIYENVPLPWRSDSSENMRTRTQSINSAPEIKSLQSQFNQMALNQSEAPMSVNSKENLYANIEKRPSNNNNNNVTTITINSDSSAAPPTDFSLQQQSVSNLQANVTTMSTASSSFDTTTSSMQDKSSTSMMDSSNASSTKSGGKKRRWAILMGRKSSSSTSSGDKVKSATLGREKEKKDKEKSNVKHRWSTGLPRFNPLPPSISKESMCQLLENKLADNQLFFEFDKIPKKKQNADFTTALHPDNAIFNRFKDVLPYEDNRLRLTPSRNNKFGYINASHITATVGSKQRFYIAAQGPTRQTLPYFWQCVWEAEVYLMVQLTDPSEDLMYLPDAGERCIDINQDYQVWWEFSQKTGHCVTSKVRLCHVASRRYRTIWHLHYTDWGDQGCPNSVAHFLGFLEEMQSVHQHSMGEIPPGHNKNPPILVHCTAGVGRTGLTILSDLLLYTVDHNQEVCISRVVGLLRHQRAYMVQTVSQYRFVYSLLIHYLKQTRLI